MRVLQIGLSSIMGGIESFSLNYFDKLSQSGVVFDYADIYGTGIAGTDRIEALGGKIVSFPNYKTHPLRFLTRMTEILSEDQYDVVHINMQTAANILPVLAANRAGITPIVHGHTVNAVGTLRSILHRVNVGQLRKIPSIHLACSQEAGEWLWNAPDFQIIPNAIDLDRFAFSEENRTRIRQKLGVGEDAILLGYVGRLEAVKNPLFVVHLLAWYTKAYPASKIKLVMLGDGSLAGQIRNEIKEKGLENAVIMEGLQKNVSEYLSAMDIFLMPSLHEAMSLAAVEAQSNGLCCLFSDTISTDLRILKTAEFLPLDDLQRWATSIASLTEKPRCGRISATDIVEKTQFNINQSAQTLLRVYREAMRINGRSV